MKTQAQQVKNLNAEQLKTFNSLVRLGDSVELALKTVLEIKQQDKTMYKIAYN